MNEEQKRTIKHLCDKDLIDHLLDQRYKERLNSQEVINLLVAKISRIREIIEQT